MVKNDFSPKRILFLGRISYVYSNFIGFLLLCCCFLFLSNKHHALPVTGVIILQAGLEVLLQTLDMIYSTVSLMLCDFMSPFPSPWRVYIFLVPLQTDNADSPSDVSYLLSSPAVKTASCLFYTSWCFFSPLTSLGRRPVYLFPSISSAMDQNCQDNLMVH